jgi:trans-aconitate 2-methyltransferase
VAEEWDARTYDRVSEPQARWGASVVERLGGAQRVLDAGCGSGRVTEQVLRRHPGVRVVALDNSQAMLDQARERLAPWAGRVEFVRADLAAPLPPFGPFDTGFSTAVFHWIADHQALFRSLASVLGHGGRLVAQWGGHGNIASVVDAMARVGLATDMWNFATEQETARRLARAGFESVRVWSHADPAVFDSRRSLEEFLDKVVLFEALAGLTRDDRRRAVAAVADKLDGLTIDYVRLNAEATLRAPAAQG